MVESLLPLPALPQAGSRLLRTQQVDAGLGPVEQEVHVLAAPDGTLADWTSGAVAIRTFSRLAFHATGPGGRTAFDATVLRETLANNVEALVGVFLNPAGSNVDVVVHTRALSGQQQGRWRRVLNPTVTLPPVGTGEAVNNRGGGTNSAAARLYSGASGVTATGGTTQRTNYLPAYHDASEELAGSVVLRPGRAVAWHFRPEGAAGSASLFLAWHERPASA